VLALQGKLGGCAGN